MRHLTTIICMHINDDKKELHANRERLSIHGEENGN